MPVARQNGFAIKPLEGRRALAAAEEGEVIRAAAGYQRPGQLQRDRSHAYAQRPPACCHIDREPGHEWTVPRQRRKRSFALLTCRHVREVGRRGGEALRAGHEAREEQRLARS